MSYSSCSECSHTGQAEQKLRTTERKVLGQITYDLPKKGKLGIFFVVLLHLDGNRSVTNAANTGMSTGSTFIRIPRVVHGMKFGAHLFEDLPVFYYHGGHQKEINLKIQTQVLRGIN